MQCYKFYNNICLAVSFHLNVSKMASIFSSPSAKNIIAIWAADVQAQLDDLASNNKESEGQINTSEVELLNNKGEAFILHVKIYL